MAVYNAQGGMMTDEGTREDRSKRTGGQMRAHGNTGGQIRAHRSTDEGGWEDK
jgi:hypothetical protein